MRSKNPVYLALSSLVARPTVLAALALLGLACAPAPEGLQRTPDGSGPMVWFDLEEVPLPEIPLPNDLATRADPDSPTGRRLNVSLLAPTRLEAGERSRINTLAGFGVLMPISVRFRAPLDVADLLRRHRDNLDFADDAVFVVAIDPRSPAFGRPVPLDVGRGNYPLLQKRSDTSFASDPRADAGNLLFDTYTEDANANGRLDEGEDSDDDGVLDRSNVFPPGSTVRDGLLTFYERETDTLLLRPIVPLEEETTYAVILTDRLRGEDGAPVRSPFPWIHHLEQGGALAPLPGLLSRWRADGTAELDLAQVAFAWSFTTQSITGDLVAIREGLHGAGSLAWLAERFPPAVVPDRCQSDESAARPYVVQVSQLMEAVKSVGALLLGGDISQAQPLIDTYQWVDYFTSGSFWSPDFMGAHEAFSVDRARGRARVGATALRFLMAVPKESERHHPPFPVVIYCHGYSSTRAEMIGFAGTMARYGLATVSIDAWGHGIPLDEELTGILVSAGNGWGFGPFMEAMLRDRARDLTGDGANDSGGDFWTAYAFHTRDAVTQSVVDYLQLARALQAFDGTARWDVDQDGDGQPDLAGDFDGDGRVDAGGPGVPYYTWGQSMGGIHSAILGPAEPTIVAAAPTSGGGGLADVGVRTMLGNVRDAVLLRTMGPLLVGEPETATRMLLRLHVPLANQERALPLGRVEVPVGTRVEVHNLNRGETFAARVRPGPRLRISVPCDTGDRFRVIFRDERGDELLRLDEFTEDVFYWDREEPTYRAGDPLEMPTEGFGLARCTPALRRMVGLFQMMVEPADPAAWAPHYFLDPLPIRPEGPHLTNLLEVITLGDQEVPVSTQITIARAAGVLPALAVDARYGVPANDFLIANFVPEGLAGIGRFPGADILFDPDDLDEGTDGYPAPAPAPALRLRQRVETPTGVSGVRFAYVNPRGQHGIFIPDPNRPFDVDNYFANLIAHFFGSGGKVILDDRCLEDASCPLP
ncbi:MAG: hypothetical protein GYA21_14090 [Myxococcales bacterium]|nr:hypothetical protein [Myxococcales bacterium]